MKKITAIFLVVMAFLASCEESPIVENTLQNEREAIELSLGTLVVEQMKAGTAEAEQQQGDDKVIPFTKSSLSSEPSTDIKNLWLFQFANDGRLVGRPQYIETYAPGTTKVKLIPTGTGEAAKSTIVYIANTFKDDLIQFAGSNYTIDDLHELTHSITDEESNFITDGANKYMVMYGSIKQNIISSGALNECTLHRTVAKISVTIVNNISDKLTFSAIALSGVPNVSNYFPTETGKLPVDNTFSTFAYAKEDINITEQTNLNFTFYAPTNRRGKVNNNSEQQKNHFAMYNATAIDLVAEDESGEFYCYTFYLGANLTNDFNIECDKEYKYTLTFNDKGDPDTDLRVESLSKLDFTPQTMSRSNCYILNPSSTEVTYYIPIDRIDQFWDPKNGYVVDDIYETNTLDKLGDNWETVFLWHDSEYTLAGDGTQDLGGLKIAKGTSPLTGKPCVVVTLPANYPTCNVGYVVRKTNVDKDILWSWHLWITDYDPYPKNLKPSLGIWNYSVEGGELHRYDIATFVGGIYSEKFIMDRNLGAHGASFEGHGSITDSKPTHPGSLYYQFGRKDPFPCIVTKYLNGYTYGTVSTEQDFKYAVNHPNTYVGSFFNNWCIDADAEATTYIWNDHKISVFAYNTGKSIFDPSPWGFRVPVDGTWAGFDLDCDVSANETMYEYPHFPWATTPYSIEAGRIHGFAYYPASGYRFSISGALSSGGINGYSWSATPIDKTRGCNLYFNSTSVYPSYNFSRANGFPVRPVQE